MTEPDGLRAGLADAASSIDPGDMQEARAGVHRVAHRRSRRTRAGVGLAMCGLLVAGGVTLASLGEADETRTIAIIDPTTSQATTSTDPADPVTTDAASAGSAAGDQQPGAIGVSSPAGVVVESPDFGFDAEQVWPLAVGWPWAVAWQGGFLVANSPLGMQRLPEALPDEVMSLFPPEVVALFPDGLPATIGEAESLLNEADLLNEVTEILAANPEANAAVFSVDQTSSPEVQARFSPDGESLEPVEMKLPDGIGNVLDVATVGDRLVIVAVELAEEGSTIETGPALVATTKDLVTWTTQTIELPVLEIEQFEFVEYRPWPSKLVVNESGWAIKLFAGLHLDLNQLLPENDLPNPASGEVQLVRYDGEGVTVQLEPNGDGPARYTWSELGVSADDVGYVMGAGGDHQIWAAAWEAEPVRSDSAIPDGELLATDSGFLAFDDQVWFSADGLTWTSDPLPEAGLYVDAALSYGGGAIIVVADAVGHSTLYRVGATGSSIEPIAISGLPDKLVGVGGDDFSDFSLVLQDAAPFVIEPLVMRHGQYLLSWDDRRGSYELREDSTEAVLASEEIDVRSGKEDYQHLVVGEGGVSVFDAESDELIVEFPMEVFQPVFAERDVRSLGVQRDYWLLATTDGTDFLVADLPDHLDQDIDKYAHIPDFSTANGEMVLVQQGHDWIRYDFS